MQYIQTNTRKKTGEIIISFSPSKKWREGLGLKRFQFLAFGKPYTLDDWKEMGFTESDVRATNLGSVTNGGSPMPKDKVREIMSSLIPLIGAKSGDGKLLAYAARAAKRNTINDMFDSWHDNNVRLVELGEKGKRYANDYRLAIKPFLQEFGMLKPSELKTTQIYNWILDMRGEGRGKAAQRAKTAASAMWSSAPKIGWGERVEPISWKFNLSAPETERTLTWSLQQILTVCDIADNPMAYADYLPHQKKNDFYKPRPEVADAILFAYYSGQRPDDVLTLRWSDIRSGMLVKRQSKTGNEIFIPIHSRLQKRLELIKERHVVKGWHSDYILHTSDGEAIGEVPKGQDRTKRISDRLRKLRPLIIAVDPTFTTKHQFRGLRHSAATELQRLSAAKMEIAAITGHKRGAGLDNMLNLYAHQSQELAERAIKLWEEGEARSTGENVIAPIEFRRRDVE